SLQQLHPLLAVFASPHLHRLQELGLSGWTLRIDVVRFLVGLSNLVGLRKLSFQRVDLGVYGAAALAEARLLTRLSSLRCSEINLSNVEAQALAASPYLDNLQELDLRGNDLISRQTRQLLYVRFGNRVHF